MRILQIGKYYPPSRGGMETVLRLMCEGLLDRGHDVTALVSGQAWRDREELIAGPRSGRTGRLLRAGTWATVNGQPLSPGLPRRLAAALRDEAPDVVQLHLPHPAACAAALRALPRRGCAGPALCVWYHADITRQRLGAGLVRPLIRACLGRAEGIAVSTATLRDRSRLLAPHRARVRVIPFGIDADSWAVATPEPDGPFLFVGRLVYYKGLRPLLEAVRRTPAARLVVVGDGPLRRDLERRGRGAGLAGRVRFAGELPEDELRREMGRARALVLPSDGAGETFGVVQLEAMAAGLPVISTRLPTGVAEVNRDGETGRVVPPGDAAALAEALAEILAAPAQARAWGEAGRRRVGARFGWDTMLDALEAWYADACAGRG
jgi:glycosyltransferase involved in cell wall biosynthesis